MKFFEAAKDGGPESYVSGFFVIEWKKWFSLVLLHFSPGSRAAYHSHAFNAFSWVLKGRLEEREINGKTAVYTPSARPILTWRSTFHQVVSVGHTWALSLRGPWSKTWEEYIPREDALLTLTHGREVVASAVRYEE